MKYKEAVRALHKGTKTRFTLTGPEGFFKEMFIKEAGKLERDTHIFYQEAGLDALSMLQSGDLFGADRTLVLYEVDKMKEFGSLVQAMQISPDLIICTVSPKANVKSKGMTELIAATDTVPCDKLREYGTDYPLFIASMASSYGYTMRDGADDALFSMVGPDLHRLYTELTKVMAVKDPGDISPSDVRTYATATAEAGIFDIFDKAMRKDVLGTLKLYETYPKSNASQHELLKMMSNYYEKMYRILLLREQKFESDDVADIVGIPKFLVRTRYMPRAVALGKSYIAGRLNKLCELEAAMRIFKGNKNILMYQFIYELSV